MKNKKNVLITWIGKSDSQCAQGTKNRRGPIIDIFLDYGVQFDNVYFLYDSNKRNIGPIYIDFFKKFMPFDRHVRINSHHVRTKGHNDFKRIYITSKQIISYMDLKNCKYYINMSSGTGIMASCWALAIERSTLKKHERPILLETGIDNKTSEIDFDEF